MICLKVHSVKPFRRVFVLESMSAQNKTLNLRRNRNILHNDNLMIKSQDIKKGVCIRMDGKLYFCIDFLHVKPGKGNTIMRTTLN